MNCDDVFAILTRGPFPSGDRHDRLVEAHLQQCPDCQRLAEALRPNDENRPEAVAPEDTVSLPGYWGGPLHAETRPIISLAQTPGQARRQPSRSVFPAPAARGRRVNLLPFLAAVALGIVLAAVLRTLVGTSEHPVATTKQDVGKYAGGRGGMAIADFDHRNRLTSVSSECLRSMITVEHQRFQDEARRNPFDAARLDWQNCCSRCHGGDGVVDRSAE